METQNSRGSALDRIRQAKSQIKGSSGDGAPPDQASALSRIKRIRAGLSNQQQAERPDVGPRRQQQGDGQQGRMPSLATPQDVAGDQLQRVQRTIEYAPQLAQEPEDEQEGAPQFTGEDADVLQQVAEKHPGLFMAAEEGADDVDPEMLAQASRDALAARAGEDEEAPGLEEQMQQYRQTPLRQRAWQQLKAGWKGLQQQRAGTEARRAEERLSTIKRLQQVGVEPGDRSGLKDADYELFVETAEHVPEFLQGDTSLAKLRAESARQLSTASEDVARYGAEAQSMQRNPFAEEIGQTEGFGEVLQRLKENPGEIPGLIQQFGLESLPRSAPSLIMGALGTAAGGPVTGALAAGGQSAGTEYESRILQGLQEHGVDTNDPEAVQAALENDAIMASVREEAGKAAGAIGALDAASFGVAGKMLSPQMKSQAARQVVNQVMQSQAQGGLGAGGEALAQLSTKGELSAGEVAAEYFGEFIGTPLEVAAAAGPQSSQQDAGTDQQAEEDADQETATVEPTQEEGEVTGEERQEKRAEGAAMSDEELAERFQNAETQAERQVWFNEMEERVNERRDPEAPTLRSAIEEASNEELSRAVFEITDPMQREIVLEEVNRRLEEEAIRAEEQGREMGQDADRMEADIAARQAPDQPEEQAPEEAAPQPDQVEQDDPLSDYILNQFQGQEAPPASRAAAPEPGTLEHYIENQFSGVPTASESRVESDTAAETVPPENAAPEAEREAEPSAEPEPVPEPSDEEIAISAPEEQGTEGAPRRRPTQEDMRREVERREGTDQTDMEIGRRSQTETEQRIDARLEEARSTLQEAQRDLAEQRAELRERQQESAPASENLFGESEEQAGAEQQTLEGMESRAPEAEDFDRILEPFQQRVERQQQRVLDLEEEAATARRQAKRSEQEIDFEGQQETEPDQAPEPEEEPQPEPADEGPTSLRDVEPEQQDVLDGRYQGRIEDGEIRIRNADTGNDVDGRSSNYESAVAEFLSENAGQVDEIGRAVTSAADVRTPSEYVDRVATESSNPMEVAEALVVARQMHEEGSTLDPVAEALLDRDFRFTPESFDQFGDPNVRRDTPAINLRWIKRDGTGIDEVARDLSNETGTEVTPDDIIAFILDNPSRRRPEQAAESQEMKDLRQRFRDVTGVRLTDSLHDQILDQSYAEPAQEDQRDARGERAAARAETERGDESEAEVPFRRRRRGAQDAPVSGRQRVRDRAEGRQRVKEFAESYAESQGLPEANVVDTWEDLPAGARLAYERGLRLYGDAFSQPAMYHNGQGHIIADEVVQAAREAGMTEEAFTHQAYLHEIVAHRGLGELLGNDFATTMREVAGIVGIDRLRETGILEAYAPESSGAGSVDELTGREAELVGEEYLAHLAEGTEIESNVIRRVLDALRRALVKGKRIVGIELNDADLKLMLRAAADNLRGRQADNPIGRTRFMLRLQHGTPYAFDRFSLAKIGSGEGAQAFGWGLYFTNSEDVARHYAESVNSMRRAQQPIQYKGVDIEGEPVPGLKDFLEERDYRAVGNVQRHVRNAFALADVAEDETPQQFKEAALEYFDFDQPRHPEDQREEDLAEEFIRKQMDAADLEPREQVGRYIYDVTVHNGKTPDEYNYLPWRDEPSDEVLENLRDQAQEQLEEAVEQYDALTSEAPMGEWREAGARVDRAQAVADVADGVLAGRGITAEDLPTGFFGNVGDDTVWITRSDDEEGMYSYNASNLEEVEISKDEALAAYKSYKQISFESEVPGGDMYQRLRTRLGSPKEASMALLEVGIDGIQYRANQGRSESLNYVVFDEEAIEVENRTRFQRQKKDAGQLDMFMGEAAPDDLVALHNIAPRNLRRAARVGGLPVPSLAVLKPDLPFTGFGNISLVAPRELVDPESTPVFDADVYSPRVPPPEADINRKVWTDEVLPKLLPHFEDIEEMHSIYSVERAIEHNGPERAALEAMRETGLELAYVRDQGVDVDVPMRSRKTRWDDILETSAMQSYLNDLEEAPTNGTDEERSAKLKAMGEAYREAVDEYISQKIEASDTFDEKDAEMLKQGHLDKLDEETERMHFGPADRLWHSFVEKRDSPEEVDTGALQDTLRDHVADLGGAEQYEAWVRETLEPAFGEEHVTHAGEKLTYNLDSLVRVMTSKGVRGLEDNLTFGRAQARSAGAKRYRSVDQMKSETDRLVTEEEMQEVKDRLEEEGDHVIESLLPHHKWERQGTWSKMDNVYEALADYLKGPKRRSAAESALRGKFFEDVPADKVQMFMEHAHNLVTAPTEYFEAKPQRAVGLGEFRAAVVPDDVPSDVRSMLEDAGLEVMEYPAGDQDARTEMIAGLGEARFMRRPAGEDTDTDQSADDLMRHFVDRYAQAQEEDPKETGRPELANPARDEDVRRAVDTADQLREEAGKPEEQSFEQWRSQAARLLEDDYEGQKTRLLSGEMEGPVDVMMAKQVLRQEGREAVSGADRDQLIQFARMVDSYRDQRSDQARALAAGRDPEKTPEERAEEFLMEAILMPDDDTARKLRSAETEKERRRIEENHADTVGDVIEALRSHQLHPDLFDDFGDRSKVAHAVRLASSAKASTASKLYEFWISGLLSLPTTQSANTIGNAVNATFDFSVQRMMEAAINSLPGDQVKGADFGELTWLWKGLMGSTLTQAWDRARMAFDTEAPVFAEEMGYDGVVGSKVEEKRSQSLRKFEAAISGRKGRIIRLPLRGLVAVDEMFKSIFWNMEAGAQAYRIAKDEGLEGQALADRIQELTNDPMSDAGIAAYNKALDLTFQTDFGELGQKFLKFRSARIAGDWKPVSFMFPFLVAPTNIIKTGVRKSPFGSVGMLVKAFNQGMYSVGVTDDARFQYKRNEWTRDVAEQVLAWSAFWGLWSMAAAEGGEDDELPRITGTGASFGEQGRREFEYRALPEMSIRLGGAWYSYARIEPLSTPLALSADMVKEIQAAENGKEVADAVSGAWRNVLDILKEKTFLRSLGDLIRAFEYEGGVARFASNFLTSWSPNIVRGSLRNADDAFRDYSVRTGGDRSFFLETLKRGAQKMVPLEATAPPPRVDLWGRPSERYQGDNPATDYLWRMTLPIWRQRVDRATALDRLILNWNNQNPEDGFYPRTPRASFRVLGETVRMSAEEYHEFLERSGKRAFERLKRQRLDAREPTEKDIEAIEDELRGARSHVKEEMAGEGKFDDLTEQQRDELTGSGEPGLQRMDVGSGLDLRRQKLERITP